MSITFASGGFSGTMRSDADGNIFVETQGDSKTITIGSVVAYTGSVLQELDPATGNVLFQKEFKSDGTIEEAKFKASGERMETKVKNPSAGKEFIRSGSATANQIEFEQTTAGAFITVSGSSGNTGFNLVEADKFKLIKSTHTNYISGTTTTTTAVNQVDAGGNWQYNVNSGLLKTRTVATQFTVSSSGDIFVKNNISASGTIFANGLEVTHFTSSFVTASTIQTEGSNVFGDAATDTHTFNGNITASKNISASGDVFGVTGSFDYMTVSDEIARVGDPDTRILFTDDDINITVGGMNMVDFTEGSTDEITFNESAQDLDVRIEGEDDANLLFTDATSPGGVGIGTNTPGEKLEVIGNISASGQLIAASANFNDGNISNVGTIDLDNIRGDGDTDTNIAFGGDKITFTAGNIEMLKLVEGVADAVTINEGGVDVNLRVESNNKTHMLFVDGGNDAVGIGNSVPSTELTVEGAISSSTGISSSNATFTGDISANSASFNYITASHIDTDGDSISIGGEKMSKILITNLKRGHSSTVETPAGRIQKTTDVFVTGNVSASGDFLNSQFVQMTNSSSVINTFDTGSHQTCKYLLQVKSGSDVQSSEMLLIQHGLTASNTEYAQINSGLNLVDFTTAISASTVQLIASSSFLSCSVKFIRTLI